MTEQEEKESLLGKVSILAELAKIGEAITQNQIRETMHLVADLFIGCLSVFADCLPPERRDEFIKGAIDAAYKDLMIIQQKKKGREVVFGGDQSEGRR